MQSGQSWLSKAGKRPEWQFTRAGGGGRRARAGDGAAETFLWIANARAAVVTAQPQTLATAAFGALTAMHIVIKNAA